ncbi:DUF6427 family protein [Pelobium sp.]|nr:DUF6427 family protein [Pelobium sp.]MDA9554689.1 DUF6427 family protein [Pelobium sp.]
MIQQFKNFSILNLFLLFILLFALRFGAYLDLPESLNTGFSELFSRLLLPISIDTLISPAANISIAAVILFIQALFFNKIVNDLNIIGKASFLPALFYVVAGSIFTPFLYLSPPLICNFFLLFIIYKIMAEYKGGDAIGPMFDLGLIVAIGTLFYFPFVLFLLFLWASLVVLRPFNWREWVGVLMGYLTVVFFLGVYYFWNGRLLDFYEIWKPLSNKFPFYIKIQVTDYIVLLPIAICLFLGFVQLRINFFKSFVQVRKFFQLLFYLFLFSTISFYLKAEFRISHFLMCVIPVSVLLAYYFAHAKRRWIYESFFLVIIGFIIYFQFV